MSETVQTREIALCVNELCCEGKGELSEKGGLKNISFSFDKKGIHGILAPKGSGKTRILDIICGCDTEYSGEISVCGASVSRETDEAKKIIGYAQKKNAFYPDMTVTEILSFVGEARRVESGKLYRQIKEAIDLVGLDAVKNRLVKKLTDFECKKLAIAASLLGNPEILVFDEMIKPRMGDARREELEGLIRMLGRIKTVIITTDDYKIAKGLCEDVVIISDGQILAKGDFDTLEAKVASSDVATTLESMYNSLAAAYGKKYGN